MASMMSRISNEDDSLTKYTKHCSRANVAKGFQITGKFERLIISVSRQTNKKSLDSYF